MIPAKSPERRYAILAEGWFANRHAKTAHGLVAYGRDEVVAVVDSTLAGRRVLEVMPNLRRDAPFVGTLGEALERKPTSILVGLAPAGGKLPEEWMETLREAADAGLEIVSGLHQRLADLPDPRSGEGFTVEPKVALTVGTNSAIGKMTATLEIERAAREAGLSTGFVATGQTGIVVAGWGICVDAVVSDFIAGASEQLVLAAARASSRPDLILVEGQGSLGHPAYSGVTLGLLHGSCPDCLVLCADASEGEVFAGVPSPDVARIVRLYEEVAALVKPAPVVAVSVNAKGLDEEAAENSMRRLAKETGLPVADPVRGSTRPILDAIRRAPKTEAVKS